MNQIDLGSCKPNLEIIIDINPSLLRCFCETKTHCFDNNRFTNKSQLVWLNTPDPGDPQSTCGESWRTCGMEDLRLSALRLPELSNSFRMRTHTIYLARAFTLAGSSLFMSGSPTPACV